MPTDSPRRRATGPRTRFATPSGDDPWGPAEDALGGAIDLDLGLDSVIEGIWVQVLATRAAELPRLICVGLEGGRRELQRHLLELGISLTGDVARAEVASERACGFI